MKFQSDIDIDFSDRNKLLEHIKHIPASMRKVSPVRKHATGVYVTDIPYDAINNMSNLDYADAENRGYTKLDLLNVYVYNHVKDEKHLVELMHEPDWDMLKTRSVVKNLVHLSNHYDTLRKMPEPVNSIPRLAMFLAIIRPAKKHLQGLSWSEIAKTVWEQDENGYVFKKSHSVGYAWLVAVHMNLIKELGNTLN